MEFLGLPPEVLLIILEWLALVSPFTLFAAVPGTHPRLRALCARTHADLSNSAAYQSLDTDVRAVAERREVAGLCINRWKIAVRGLLYSAVRHFPFVRGLWTAFPLPLHTVVSGRRNYESVAAIGRLLRAADAPKSALGQFNLRKQTPLIAASFWGDERAVRELLGRGSQPNLASELGASALFGACEQTHWSVVAELIKGGAHPNAFGNRPLCSVCRNGNAQAAELLLKHGASPSLPGDGGTTPLIHASRRGHPQIVQMLLDAGAPARYTTGMGESAFIAATFGGHSHCARILLEASAREAVGD